MPAISGPIEHAAWMQSNPLWTSDSASSIVFPTSRQRLDICWLSVFVINLTNPSTYNQWWHLPKCIDQSQQILSTSLKADTLPIFLGGICRVHRTLDFLVSAARNSAKETLCDLYKSQSENDRQAICSLKCKPHTGSRILDQSLDLDMTVLLLIKSCATAGRVCVAVELGELEAWEP